MKIYVMFALIGWAWVVLFAIIALLIWTVKSKRSGNEKQH